MTKKEIEKQELSKIVGAGRERARVFGAKILQLRTSSVEFRQLDDELRKAQIENKVTKTLLEAHKNALKNAKIDEPQSICKTCSDSGYVDGRQCLCLKNAIYQALATKSGIGTLALKTFDDCDINIFEPRFRPTAQKIYDYFKKLTREFEKTPQTTFVVHGKSGAGKTHLFSAVAGELLKNQISTLFVTAFALNNMFLSYHTSFDAGKENLLEPVLDADALFIDDLGTERLLNNITEPYLLMLLKERCLAGKKTFVNTNLSPEQLLERYGERIFSRLFDKRASIAINFENDNLRM